MRIHIPYASGSWWHVYDEWGESYGGADQAADYWFRKIRRRVANREYRKASKALGYFAHIVGDIAQPMHTDGSDREDRIHSSYESAVDTRVGTYRFDYNGYHHAAPVGRVVVLARKSHRFYTELVRTYDRHGYNARVDEITRRQLDRGANVLADLIDSL